MTPTRPVMRAMLIFWFWLPLALAQSQNSPSAPTSPPQATPQVLVPDGLAVANELQRAVSNSDARKRYHEVDILVERTVRFMPNNRHVLFQAARIYAELEPAGYWINGRYRRGDEVGTLPEGARRVYSKRRDHRRALQLLERALLIAETENPSKALADFYWEAAQIFTGDKGYAGLYTLTDLAEVPTLDLQEPPIPEKEPVPVDEEGNPVFFEIPSSWKTARNDGERLLWLLQRARRLNPEFDAEAEFIHTQYLLRSYLEVETITTAPHFDPQTRTYAGEEESESAFLSIPDLGPNETVTRLSTGIRRITLPDAHNYISKFEALATEPRFASHAEESLEILAEIFENRRQYERSSHYWQESIRRFGSDEPSWESRNLAQITEGWGTFEPTSAAQAGDPIQLAFWYRNSTHVHFQAYRVDVNRLLSDMLTYLRGDPFPLDQERIDLSQLGRHLVREGSEQYLDQSVAAWEQALTPRPNHWDERIEVDLPFSMPGAYLVEAKLQDGNTSTVMVWINDMSIVRRDVKDGRFYYVADKRKGTPIPWVKFSFIGYRLEPVGEDEPIPLDETGEEIPEPLRRQYHVLTKETTQWADAKGQLIVGDDVLESGYHWFLLANAPGERVALLGFSDLVADLIPLEVPSGSKHFITTDKLYYHPGDTVRAHAWLRKQANEDEKMVLHNIAAKEVRFTLHDPEFRPVWSQNFLSDDVGSILAEFQLPTDLNPGRYRLVTENGGSTGSVEVEVANRSTEPPLIAIEVNAPLLKRGEEIVATVRGRFSDGQALSGARLKCRVVRRQVDASWYPQPDMAWLYGPTYGWTSQNYEWFPGWRYWGWPAPGGTTPEVIAFDQEITLDEEGEFTLTLPTISEGSDQEVPVAERYDITTEWAGATPAVRSEVSTIVSERGFKVHTQLDRSYYRVGDEAVATIQALDYLGEAVTGKARFIVYHIEYDEEGKPKERGVVGDYFNLSEEGNYEKRFRIDKPGQYRVSCEIAGPNDEKIEGASVTTFVDDAFNGEGCRFNPLEIIADQPHYRPGDTVTLRLNTQVPGQSVALFVRPRDGANAKAEVIRLDQRSRAYEIKVTAADAPSFQVEAIALSNGDFEIHSKDIPVITETAPPLEITCDLPKDHAVKPGVVQSLTFTLPNRQPEDMAPVQLMVRLQPHDPKRELINFRRFFWNPHQPYEASVEHDLSTRFESYAKPPETAMKPIGLFGPLLGLEGTIEDEPDWSTNEASLLPRTHGWLTTTQFDQEGRANVEVPLPDTNGSWRIEAFAMTPDSSLGSWTSTIQTQEPFHTDFQHPRFAVVGDVTTVSARLQNLSRVTAPVSVSLDLEGATLEVPEVQGPHLLTPMLRHESSWTLKFADTEESQLQWTSIFDGETASRINILPIEPREQFSHQGWAGRLSQDHQDSRYAFNIEATQNASLSILLAPSLAALVIEGASHIIKETPSSAPAEMVAHRLTSVLHANRLLMGFNIDPAALPKSSAEFAAVLDPAQRHEFYRGSFDQLAALQHEDGGWSWSGKTQDPSDTLTTAWVARALLAAKRSEIELPASLLDRSLNMLKQKELAQCVLLRTPTNEKKQADVLDAFVFFVLTQGSSANEEMGGYLFRDWEKLPHYGKLNVALALHERGDIENRNTIRFYFGEKLLKDEERDTLALQSDQEPVRSLWHGSESDLQSLYLLFLARAKGPSLVTDNVADGALNFREEGGLWGNLRATSMAFEAVVDYALLSEAKQDSKSEVQLTLDDAESLTVPIDSAIVPVQFSYPGTMLSGDHVLTLTQTGSTPLYHYVRLTSKKEPAKISHPDISLSRTYMSSFEPDPVSDDGNQVTPPGSLEHPLPPEPTPANGVVPPAPTEIASVTDAPTPPPTADTRATPPAEAPDMEAANAAALAVITDAASILPIEDPAKTPAPIISGAVLATGDVVEVTLTVQTQRELEQVMLEDSFPAGCEVLPDANGKTPSQSSAGRVAFFVHKLPVGTHEFRYRIKARYPGRYHALPASVRTPFHPELKATSEETILSVEGR